MTLIGRITGMIAVVLATIASFWWIFYFFLKQDPLGPYETTSERNPPRPDVASSTIEKICLTSFNVRIASVS